MVPPRPTTNPWVVEMQEFQKSIKRISKELVEMDIQLQSILSKAKDARREPTEAPAVPHKIPIHVIRQQESLLGPLLDATKMSLKLIQANSLELLSSLQSLVPDHSDLQERFQDLEQRFHITLNRDIETRAIDMVKANREFANLVVAVVMRYSEDLKTKDLRELQERQRILREKKEEYEELQKETKVVKAELATVEADRDRLEKILNNLLKEIRLIRLTDDVDPQEVLPSEIEAIAPFQEVYELNRCSLAILKFGSSGPEVVVAEKLSFMPPETDIEFQNDWLTKIGIYYITIVGQGETYASGLFGPLPVRDYDDYLAYVFSFMAEDPTHPDKRTEGKCLALICFFFPKHIEVAYASFSVMKNILDFLIGRTKPVIELDSDFLAGLRESLVGVLTERALDGSRIDQETELKMEEVIAQSDLWRIVFLALDRSTLEKSLASLLDQIWPTLQSFDAKSLKVTFSNGAEIQGRQIRDSSRRLRLGNPWRNVNGAVILLPKNDTSWTEAHALVTTMQEIVRQEIPLGVCDSPPAASKPISAVRKHVNDFVNSLVEERRIIRTSYSDEISSTLLKKAILALGSKKRRLNLALSQKT
ncbi:MAG: hypothetical protein ACFFB3_17010 [Candidatus Hodarchaeota archaeon]